MARKVILAEQRKGSQNLNEKLIKFTLPSPNPEEPQAAASTKARILVAEDDPVSRILISTRLTNWGYEVVLRNDGAEAMAVLRAPDAPSLAIPDGSMPNMNGLEICRRAREAGKRIYIILLTARGRKENIVEGVGAGAGDEWARPVEPC